MSTYKKEFEIEKKQKLREILQELPDFCRSFFISIENNTSILTQINYAYDLRLFFNFLITPPHRFNGRNVKELTAECLNQITIDDLYDFLNYISLYENEHERFIENHERGKARKIAALRSFFKYFYKKQVISENICSLIDTPKIHEKAIIKLEPNEIADLLDAVESGELLSVHQKAYHQKTVLRDVAIFTLFLSTGIRISELVSLDIADLDFSANAFAVTRKGGNQTILYFGNEAKTALKNYLAQRKTDPAYTIHAPLFTSLQNKRMSVRAVQELVKKYTQGAVPLKHISPHKLRSTFGTMLYNETEDIYMVADVLGHKDVNTTRKHYASMSEDIRRKASKAVKLRD